jgi:hypothetical protein
MHISHIPHQNLRLASNEAVRRFIEEADPDLAKKVGAHASSLLVEALGSPLESW